MIRCSFVNNRLRALADGELSPGETARLLAHLDACAACRREYARVQGMVQLLQEQEPETEPAHFSAGLQVRLASHRRARASARRPWRSLLPGRWSPRRRWAGGLTVAIATLALFFVTLSQSVGAAEVARRAERSWTRIQNYGCVFVSTGMYQGKPRTFIQRQFFRRPGEFRLETAQDYPLTTFVFEDRVIHEIRGGDWEGKGPLVIVRPRREGQAALPFPFGMTWQSGGNVSLDQLIRQLGQNQDAEIVGTEAVNGLPCYRVRFFATPPGGRSRDLYEMWIDRGSFLPRRVRWYRDEKNHIDTEARQLQVNYDVLPAETFDYRVPDGAFVIYGDVDPHVFALKPPGGRKPGFDATPVAAARREAWDRSGAVPFRVAAPEWLPDGFKLVRVRRMKGRWVDMYWIRERDDLPAQVIRLVQQARSARAEADLLAGEEVGLDLPERVVARLRQGSAPYRYAYLGWVLDDSRFTLSTADVDPADVLRIAGSISKVTPPPPVRVVRVSPPGITTDEPSYAPAETDGAVPAQPVWIEGTGLSAASSPETTAPEDPPMMPEVSDDDRMSLESGAGSAAVPKPAGSP